MNILILGDDEILKCFLLLKHFQNTINYLVNFDSDINVEQYDLVITNNSHLQIINQTFNGLVFNIVESNDNLCTRNNVVNLTVNFNFDFKSKSNDLIRQFIDKPSWNFYYRSCEKAYVKIIYDLFSECYEYNKIKSKEIKFHKI